MLEKAAPCVADLGVIAPGATEPGATEPGAPPAGRAPKLGATEPGATEPGARPSRGAPQPGVGKPGVVVDAGTVVVVVEPAVVATGMVVVTHGTSVPFHTQSPGPTRRGKSNHLPRESVSLCTRGQA